MGALCLAVARILRLAIESLCPTWPAALPRTAAFITRLAPTSDISVISLYRFTFPCSGGAYSTSRAARGRLVDTAVRFGFANASAIDTLLDRDDVALEAILDEDELLQECKAQNTRLIDYFQRADVLKRLLGYVTGQIEADGVGRFK